MPAPTQVGFSRRSYKIIRFLVWSLLAYLLPLFILAVNQRSLIFPAGSRLDAGLLAIHPQNGCTLLRLKTRTGDEIAGLYEPAVGANALHHPTLIYFYGNGSNIGYSVDQLEPLRRRGVNILLADYPGYGSSPGVPSEKACYATSNAVYAYATSTLHIPPSEIVIAGWSLGSAVAIDLASRVPAAGLITMSAFTNMAYEAHSQYPIYPAWLIRAVLRYPFASDRKIGRVKCPILIVHSKTDEVVPYAMSNQLAAASSDVHRIVFDHGRHGDVFTIGGEGFYDQVYTFIERVTRK